MEGAKLADDVSGPRKDIALTVILENLAFSVRHVIDMPRLNLVTLPFKNSLARK